MARREAMIAVIEALHAEIAALRSGEVATLETATCAKLAAIDTLAALDGDAPDDELRALAIEAQRLNETARVYVNLMAANVRRRLQLLSGEPAAAYAPRAPGGAFAGGYPG